MKLLSDNPTSWTFQNKTAAPDTITIHIGRMATATTPAAAPANVGGAVAAPKAVAPPPGGAPAGGAPPAPTPTPPAGNAPAPPEHDIHHRHGARPARRTRAGHLPRRH